MAEMYLGRPLFAGSNNQDELMKIFKVMGTPTEETWPGVSKLSEYRKDFPYYPPKPLSSVVPMIDTFGMDLLMQMLIYQPQRRITAKDALNHVYFNDIRGYANLQQQQQQQAQAQQQAQMNGQMMPQQQQPQQQQAPISSSSQQHVYQQQPQIPQQPPLPYQAVQMQQQQIMQQQQQQQQMQQQQAYSQQQQMHAMPPHH
jgi:serine/threonine protein kinase